MAFPISDPSQDLFNTGGELGYDLDFWVQSDVYSSPTSDVSSSPYTDMSSPSSTDIPLTPQSDFPHTPRSDYSQSLTGFEEEISMLNFEDEPTAEPMFSSAELEMGPGPWDDYVMVGRIANELPEQADLPQFTPDPALTPPLTPLVPFLPSPLGSDDSSPATPRPPPSPPASPSASRSPRIKGGRTRKSETPVRRPRRAANSSNKPKIYPCDFPSCTMSCSRPCDLAKHRKRHVKPFKCRFCDSWSSSMKDRERHELSLHRKEDHLSCKFPNCQHTTARKDNMDNHVLRKHTNRGESLEDTGHL